MLKAIVVEAEEEEGISVPPIIKFAALFVLFVLLLLLLEYRGLNFFLSAMDRDSGSDATCRTVSLDSSIVVELAATSL